MSTWRIAMLLMAGVASIAMPSQAQTRRDDWPEGSAMRGLFDVSDQVEAATDRVTCLESLRVIEDPTVPRH